MTTEFDTVRVHLQLVEACERNGFELQQGKWDGCVIKGNHPPYAKDVTLCYATNFKEALQFMQGYEQRKFEMENT